MNAATSAAAPPAPRASRAAAPVQKPARQRGLSYVEVLVAVALVASALAPALQAIASALPGARIHASLAQGMAPVHGKMEELLARPYPALLRAAASGGSPGGNAAVAIAVYDPTVTLAAVLPAAAPPGPGYSDADFDVFIVAVDPATGTAYDPAVVNAFGPDTGLLRIRVQAKAAGGGSLTAYKARSEAWE